MRENIIYLYFIFIFYAINPEFLSRVNPQDINFPLDDKDGGLRILDPIIQYYNNHFQFIYYKYFVYKVERW